VGEPGQEQTETSLISGISGNETISISALKFSHPKSTPVYITQWNKLAFERKPISGNFSEISGSPFDIDWDNSTGETLIIVSGGVTTDTYRWKFYGVGTTTYSSYADELVGTGLTRYKVGYLIQQVKKNPRAVNIEDETLIDFFNDFQALVYDEIPKAWWFTKEGTAKATAVDTYKYSISTNWSELLAIKYVLYRFISGSTDITYPLTFSPYQEFYNYKADANQSTDDNAKYWSFLPPDGSSSLGYIGIHPTSKSDDCYIIPVEEFELTNLDSYGDLIVCPYPKGYIDYAWYRIYDDIKGDTNNADKYNARVAKDILALKRRARRQLGQPELFRYRGQRGWSKQFGEQTNLNSSESRENYW
jgi:hypothetical protein